MKSLGKKTFWDEISLFQNSSIENRLFKVFNNHNFQFKYDIYIENILKTIWMFLDPQVLKKVFDVFGVFFEIFHLVNVMFLEVEISF